MSGALPFTRNMLGFREGSSLAEQIKCRCVSCLSRIRVSPFILRSLWSIQFLVHLLGLLNRRGLSSSSLVILALTSHSYSISHPLLNSPSVAVLPASKISVSDVATNGSLILSDISRVFLPLKKDLLKVNLFLSQPVWLVPGPTQHHFPVRPPHSLPSWSH